MTHDASAATGRNETHLERCDRNFAELLAEVRVVQTGVQVLFAFLLTAPLTAGFDRLKTAERAEYFVTLSLAGLAAILLIAPTAYHRLLFQLGDKQHLVTMANRLTVAGLVALGFSICGAMTLVTSALFGVSRGWIAGVITVVLCLELWILLPLGRRRAITGARGH